MCSTLKSRGGTCGYLVRLCALDGRLRDKDGLHVMRRRVSRGRCRGRREGTRLERRTCRVRLLGQGLFMLMVVFVSLVMLDVFLCR